MVWEMLVRVKKKKKRKKSLAGSPGKKEQEFTASLHATKHRGVPPHGLLNSQPPCYPFLQRGSSSSMSYSFSSFPLEKIARSFPNWTKNIEQDEAAEERVRAKPTQALSFYIHPVLSHWELSREERKRENLHYHTKRLLAFFSAQLCLVSRSRSTECPRYISSLYHSLSLFFSPLSLLPLSLHLALVIPFSDNYRFI